MLHLVLCFIVWTLISIFLFWRLITISKRAVEHLQRLHQIPCSNCAYFTGDYRLKCTVNPMIATSETAIGCRDFMASSSGRNNNQKISCSGCFGMKNCSNSHNKAKHPVFKLKLPHITHENISLHSTSLD